MVKNTFSQISRDLNEETAKNTYNFLYPRDVLLKMYNQAIRQHQQECPWVLRAGMETAKLESGLFPTNDLKTAKEGP